MKIERKPKVVCLCGSTRFFDEFQRVNFEETMKGHIVLSVGFFSHAEKQMREVHGEGVGISPEQKVALDELHRRKIDLADEVIVLNVGSYIGESTRAEIAYARATGKPLRFLEGCRTCGGPSGGAPGCWDCARRRGEEKKP